MSNRTVGLSMLEMPDHVDGLRRQVALHTIREYKSALGQFMTPSSVARFMAGLFVPHPLKRASRMPWRSTPKTVRLLYPNAWYAVARLFSAKEEKRREVAGVIDSLLFQSERLGFENHVNVFHHDKHGLPEMLARGLAVYLNTTAVDTYFRRFNGHTQVNATDLRALPYPSRGMLTALGEWTVSVGDPSQEQIDQKLVEIT